MAEKSNDPLAVWQRMFGEMQKGFSTFARGAMVPPSGKPANEGEGTTAGSPRPLGDFMERYFVNMNMPSRAQLAGIGERLQTIEGQLNDIKTLLQQMQPSPLRAEGPPLIEAAAASVAPSAAAPKPARPKRKPPSEGEK